MSQPSASPETTRPSGDSGELNLQRFYPYRLAVLADEISRALAQLYTERFDLTRPEWRVMAALADHGELPARDIAGYAMLEKMQVSRAVARLQAAGHVIGKDDPGDRRRRTLCLSARGRSTYGKIAPLALARESFILSTLTDEERDSLDGIIDKLLARARELKQYG